MPSWLDEPSLPWHREEVKRLRDVLAQAYEHMARAQDLVDGVERFPTAEIEWERRGGMTMIWRSILNEAARARKLRELVDAVLADQNVNAYHMTLREIIGDSTASGVNPSDAANRLGNTMSLSDNANVLKIEDYRRRHTSPTTGRFPATGGTISEVTKLVAALQEGAADLDESGSAWERRCALLPIDQAVESLTGYVEDLDGDGQCPSVELAGFLDTIEGKLREIVDAAESFASSESAVERRSARITIQRAADTVSRSVAGLAFPGGTTR